MTPKTRILRRIVVAALAVAAALTPLLPAPAMSQATPSRVLLAPRNPQVLAAAADAGVMPSSQHISLILTLAPDAARAAALDQYLAAVTRPSSASYRQWLTPAQFAASYGATNDQLAAVNAWAQSAGLSVDATSAGATRVTVSGSAARMQTAFATSLHLYQLNASVYFANAIQPSLPADVAPLFSAVEGLDNLPSSAPLGDFTALTAKVDSNFTAVLMLSGTTALSAAQLPEYTQLFRQAAAQGITLLLPTAAGSFADTTAVADTSTPATTATPRPSWQYALGLPADRFRATPDVSVASAPALTAALNKVIAGGRLGNIAPLLYTLGPLPGIFTQADGAAAGTWEPATGLGVIDPTKFADAVPHGTGASSTSFAATSYSPQHGQPTTFTSNVTSGNASGGGGGPTPTGTVSYVTQAGVTLGTATLVNGSASFTISNLDSGTYIFNAVYSGDAIYASSMGPTSQIYVSQEPAQLSATVSGSVTVGSNYTVTATDAATLGAPNGAITVMVSGTTTSYSGTLKTASANSSVASVIIPATMPGGITLSINCSSSLNYSCNQPLTVVVQIAKATPTLSISYSPNPPVSGGQITLNAVVSTVGSAPAPTGNVRFFDNGTTLNAGALSGGTTSTTGTVPTTATHSITATYDGDPNYNSVSTSPGSNSSSTINTTTALSSSSTTVNAGATITFTAAITPASTGPAPISGTVSFSDGGNPLGTQNVSNGVATLSTNSLSPSTSHNVTATYSGDSSYTGSTSNTVVLTGGTTTNNTTITLTASTTSPVHGSNVTFTATVAPPSGGTTPTGTVTFSDGAMQLGMSTLNGGVAVYSTSSLAGGMHNITATYNGAASLNPSTSAALIVTVTPEPTRLSFNSPTNPTFGGVLNAVVSVQANSGLSYPTGTVTVQPSGAGYTTSSTGSVTSSGTGSTGSAAVQIQETAAGSVILTATYSGDANFAASGPVSTSVTIARTPSTTSFSYGSTPPVPGQPVTFTARVAFVSTIGPSGSVQFLDGTTVLGTGTLDASGMATLTTTLSAGTHALAASYLGDTNYLPSMSPTASTGTGSSATTTTLSINPPIAQSGSAVMLNASVGPAVNNLALTGNVQFVSAGVVLCQAAVTGGNASCTINPTGAGNRSIIATYLGDANYAPSSSSAMTLQITNPSAGLTASISTTNLSSSQAATVTATVTAPAGTVPTGSVTATIADSTGAVVSSYSTPLPGTGTGNSATVSISIVAPTAFGNYTVIVACANANVTCSNVNLPITVSNNTNPNGTATLTAVVSPATAQPGSTAMVTGTITASTGTVLSGTITATIANVAGAIYSVTLPGTAVTTGTYAIPITVPATVGAYTITVTCTSSNFTCTPVIVTLNSSTTALIATTTTLTATASTTATGATTFTATVTPATLGAAAPSGSITVYDGTTPVGIALINSMGGATFSLTQNTTVTHSYTAVYSGDTLYSASTSPAITGIAKATAAVITLTASTSSAIAGTNVVLTAQVTGLTATGTAPTGTVSFYIVGTNARLLGTVPLSPGGAGTSVAVLTTTGLPSGTITIDAVYSGDTNFTTVTSNIVTLGLTDYTVTFNPPSLTILRGGSGLTYATVNFLGLSGNVTLGCTPAADSGVTCSFSPGVLLGSGTSILHVQTSSPIHAAVDHPSLRKGLLGAVSFAALLCFFLPGRRRRLVPTLLLLLLSVGLLSSSGCSQNNFNSPLTSGGSPLGTTILTITTAGSDGVNTIRHTYYVQVTID